MIKTYRFPYHLVDVTPGVLLALTGDGGVLRGPGGRRGAERLALGAAAAAHRALGDALRASAVEAAASLAFVAKINKNKN